MPIRLGYGRHVANWCSTSKFRYAQQRIQFFILQLFIDWFPTTVIAVQEFPMSISYQSAISRCLYNQVSHANFCARRLLKSLKTDNQVSETLQNKTRLKLNRLVVILLINANISLRIILFQYSCMYISVKLQTISLSWNVQVLKILRKCHLFISQ